MTIPLLLFFPTDHFRYSVRFFDLLCSPLRGRTIVKIKLDKEKPNLHAKFPYTMKVKCENKELSH